MRLLQPVLLFFGGASIALAALAAFFLHMGVLSSVPPQQQMAPLLQLDLEGKIRGAQDLNGLKAACQVVAESYRAEATCKQAAAANSNKVATYALWVCVIWCALSAFVFLWAFLAAHRNREGHDNAL